MVWGIPLPKEDLATAAMGLASPVATEFPGPVSSTYFPALLGPARLAPLRIWMRTRVGFGCWDPTRALQEHGSGTNPPKKARSFTKLRSPEPEQSPDPEGQIFPHPGDTMCVPSNHLCLPDPNNQVLEASSSNSKA